MISKELLSKVLDKNIKYISDELDDNLVPYEMPIDGWKTINVYELAYKCKEWAFNNGYSILVDILGINNYQISMEDLTTGKPEYVKDSYNTSEPETIFLACKWILDNKDIK